MGIEELMSGFWSMSRGLADDPSFRWLGPHKGVVHLALASITNACFDLWAKSRGVPLWKLLLDLTPEELVRVLDLTYLEEILSKEKALSRGFSAFKLKVGSPEESRDLRRAAMLRKLIGEKSTLMFDANQHWHLPDA